MDNLKDLADDKLYALLIEATAEYIKEEKDSLEALGCLVPF